MKTFTLTAGLLLLAFAPVAAFAEEALLPSKTETDPYSFRPSVMLGLSQWVLFGGGNIAAQLKVQHVVFAYSHGQSLHFDRVASLAMTEAERDADVKVGMPWTTGGGLGLQVTPSLHVLVEIKAHRYEITGAQGDRLGYTSFTVGPGVFYDVYLYKGLFIQPNFRWWPTVASTYDGNGQLAHANGTFYTHDRHELLPFVNVNLGWTFDDR